METEIQAIQDYDRYIKCGEILKSPMKSYKNAFLFKCNQCAVIHLFLDSFITHTEEHFKDALTLDESVTSSNSYKVDNELDAFDSVLVKLEELEDPLFPIQDEMHVEKYNEIKEEDEVNSQRSATSIKNLDMEHLDDFEDFVISTDEIYSDGTHADVDEILKIRRSKRKKRVKDGEKIREFRKDDGEISKETSNKRQIKLSPIVDDFMKSKTNVLSLIDFYKNQPDLWNKYSQFYRLRDKRKQYLQEITQNLNEKCSLALTWNQTGEIISHIYTKHREEYKRVQAQQIKKKAKKANKKQANHEKNLDKQIKRSWYYDDLNFLRPKVEQLSLQNLDPNLPGLTSEQITDILKIYQGLPHLWNTYLIENICSNKRHDALTTMLSILETEMNIKIDKTALEQYIRTIHSYFSIEKRQRLETYTSKNTRSSTSSNYDHMNFLEDHEGPFHCSECNSFYTKPLCFRLHKTQHDGIAHLICSQCKQEFKSVATYATHAKRHLEDLQFVCKECNMKFLRHSELKLHLVTHTDARPYCCEICGASYRQSNSFRKHQRRHENRFSHTCHICSKGYYSKCRYTDHMNSHMNIRSHICKICGKAFITSKALKMHSVTHDDARNHACSICGKTFKLKIGVLQHMRTHGSKFEADGKRKLI